MATSEKGWERVPGRDSGGMDQPLFGETRRRDKIINMVIAVVTGVFVAVTVVMGIISSVFLGKHKCQRLYDKSESFCIYGVDIAMCITVILLLIPQIVVVYWYRKGELEPKFRTLIYYNAVVTVFLCLVANLYFFQAGFHGPTSCLSPTPAECST